MSGSAVVNLPQLPRMQAASGTASPSPAVVSWASQFANALELWARKVAAQITELDQAPVVVSATGTGQAGSTVLTEFLSVVTSGTDVVSYIGLQRSEVWNRTGAALKIWPPFGMKFEAQAVNTSYSLANGSAAVIAVVSTTQAYLSVY